MRKIFQKIFKDKRILVIYLFVIVLLVIGVTYALNISSLNLAGTTAVIGIDEDAYGETSIDTSGIDLRPILDSNVETSLDNVIKIDFVVGGNQNNTTDEVIYDIALVDLVMESELSSQYVKWKLVKNDKEVIFYDDFSDVSSGERVVLTTTQQDLVPYNEDKSLYDSYTFYLWLSDSCQSDIDSCTDYVDQSNLLSKSISGKIEVELYTGSKNGQGSGNVIEPVNAAQHIINLYNDGSSINTVHIGGDESKPEVSLNNAQRIMLDNNGEYRYYGNETTEDIANGKYLTKNYVSFNGELWRIISSSKVFSSEEDTTGSQRLRIIRAESIGNHSWDYGTGEYDGYNNWETATLNTTLNGIYYNGTSGTCYLDGSETTCDYANGTIKGLSSGARELIDDALWYLGGNDASSELYASDYYNLERGLPDGYTLPDDSYSETVIAKLGIMYPSDYAYAADLSMCKKTGDNYATDKTSCTGTDWLFNTDLEWLLSWSSENGAHAYGVSSGNIYSLIAPSVVSAVSVRSIVVLKPNVIITGGSGTSGDPYTLNLE